MSYGKHMNSFNQQAQLVWAEKDLERKRGLLKNMISGFKYRGKIQDFVEAIDQATAQKCDQLAANLALNKTDKVVDMLPR